MKSEFNQMASVVESLLPCTRRLAIIGSSRFFHAESESTCVSVGKCLADIYPLALLTGGRAGVGEVVSRSFYERRVENGSDPQVYHLIPNGGSRRIFGTTLFTGSNVIERREVLGRLSNLYLAIEGGPGTEYESRVAIFNGATVIPVGRSGGYSQTLYGEISAPEGIAEEDWNALAAVDTSPGGLAEAVARIISSLPTGA